MISPNTDTDSEGEGVGPCQPSSSRQRSTPRGRNSDFNCKILHVPRRAGQPGDRLFRRRQRLGRNSHRGPAAGRARAATRWDGWWSAGAPRCGGQEDVSASQHPPRRYHPQLQAQLPFFCTPVPRGRIFVNALNAPLPPSSSSWRPSARRSSSAPSSSAYRCAR